ncbi:MAG: nucleotidyltransferase family protein [Agriterribacter sp.]
MKNEPVKAMIFAAGMGTRLKPWTGSHPKALAPVNGKPLLQRNIEYLKRHGIDNFVINVHHFAEQVVSFLEQQQQFGCNITISHELGEPLETGGGLKKAAAYLTDSNPFVVMNADILTDLDLSALLAFHQQHKPLVTLAVTNRQSSRVFLFNNQHALCGWRNLQTGQERMSVPESNTIARAFSGIHIIDPAIFPLLTEEGKFSLVDVYLRLAKEFTILGYDHSGGILIDVGKPESVIVAEQYFN